MEHEADVRPGGGELSSHRAIRDPFRRVCARQTVRRNSPREVKREVESLLRVRRRSARKCNTPTMILFPANQLRQAARMAANQNAPDRGRVRHGRRAGGNRCQTAQIDNATPLLSSAKRAAPADLSLLATTLPALLSAVRPSSSGYIRRAAPGVTTRRWQPQPRADFRSTRRVLLLPSIKDRFQLFVDCGIGITSGLGRHPGIDPTG